MGYAAVQPIEEFIDGLALNEPVQSLDLRVAADGPICVKVDTGPLQVFRVRELSEEELSHLGDKGSFQGNHNITRKLRTTHHEMARQIALGRTNAQVAALLGCAPGTISILKRNPAFNELIELYQAKRDEVVVDLGQRLNSVTLDALDLLHDTILEGENLTPAFVLEAVTRLADRAGHAPVKRIMTNNLNAQVSASELRQLRELHSGPSVVNPRPIGTSAHPALSEDQGPPPRGVGEQRALPQPPSQEGLSEGQGSLL